MFYSTQYPSEFGQVTIASTCDSIVGLWLEGQKYFGDTLPEPAVDRGDVPVLSEAKEWLDRYFAGEKPAVSELPLAPIGGEFRQMVWKILCEIPYGEVTTYGEIAKKMAALMGRDKMSAQAVGGAVGRNPISIIIPCHRVVGTNGSLTGYSGGVATKLRLLQFEGADLAGLFLPTKGTAL